MRELSKFKVLGITLLVTMSSYVGGTLDIDVQTLRTYGFEFDLSSQDGCQTVFKYKKQKNNNNSRFGIKPIIESGRNNSLVKGISLDHYQGVVHLRDGCGHCPVLSQISREKEQLFSCLIPVSSIYSRAGPSIA